MTTGAGARTPRSTLAAKVGASYTFDPGADGVAGIYASRVLERGIDPRVLCAEIRADLLGVPDRGLQRRAMLARSRAVRFGRGTARHLHSQAQAAFSAPLARPTREASASHSPESTRAPRAARLFGGRWPRRLAAAGMAVLLALPLGILVAGAQEAPAQARYIVQPEDTLEGVAAEFGVDPEAILAASAVQNPPELTAAEVIVIPHPGESPDDAAWNAWQRQGTSPFVVGAYEVSSGETLSTIAGSYGLDPWALATFNGIADIDTLDAGQRLRIPLTDSVVLPSDETTTEPAAVEMVAPAAYIATAAFGWGVPESAFMERIGESANPHWGYRGDIHGAWGGADNYGVYPEAMVPTLNEFGFVGDIFYGADASPLTSRLDAGMPVLTWLGYFGDTAWQQDDEGSYLLAPGMHVVTVYGYDDWGVYVSNPGRGTYGAYAWGDFLNMWSVLDGMALAVAPM